MELLKLETGIDIVHVPYRGSGPMIAAFLAGEVQMAVDPSTTVLPHIQSGRVRAIAVTSERTQREASGCADHRRSGLSQAELAILARRRRTGRHPARGLSKS